MPRRFQFSLRALLVSLFLLPAFVGAAFESFKEAWSDHVRAALACVLVSGAIFGGEVAFARGRSIVKSAILGMVLWLAIAMMSFIASVIYNEWFVLFQD